MTKEDAAIRKEEFLNQKVTKTRGELNQIQKRFYCIGMVEALKSVGMTCKEIGEKLGIPESSIRTLDFNGCKV